MSEFRNKPALFEAFPALEGKIAWTRLGEFPTPINRLKKLGKKLGAPNFYVKREDMSGDPYGGNKIRKLEFTLAEAVEKKKKTVITFGGCGSNHVLATTIYGEKLGLKTSAYLVPQPPSTFVSRNIRAYSHYGTKLRYLGNPKAYLRNVPTILRDALPGGYILPPGGSSVRGTVGFVDAAVEIKNQFDAKKRAYPDRIYIAAGSGGTMAGLMVGVKLLGMPTEIIGVRVADAYMVNKTTIGFLANKTAGFLHKLDPSLPEIKFKSEDIKLETDYLGEGYGYFTPKSREAMKIMDEFEGIHLDGTYTGKAFAAALDYVKYKPDASVLFVDTYNSMDAFSCLPEDCDTDKIPPEMRNFILED